MLERLAEFDWFSAAVFVFKETSGNALIDGLELTDHEKAQLQSHYDTYYPRLGRLFSQFWRESWLGIRSAIDYVDILPQYLATRETMLFDISFYSGDAVVHRSTDDASSVLWLATRLINGVVSDLNLASERQLSFRAEEMAAIQERLNTLGRTLQSLDLSQ